MEKVAAQKVQGKIVNYRLGPKNQRSKECLIQVPNATSLSEASRLIGRKVVWACGKAKSVGQIIAPHGKKGLVRARFRKGVPGQALGSYVELIS